VRHGLDLQPTPPIEQIVREIHGQRGQRDERQALQVFVGDIGIDQHLDEVGRQERQASAGKHEQDRLDHAALVRLEKLQQAAHHAQVKLLHLGIAVVMQVDMRAHEPAAAKVDAHAVLPAAISASSTSSWRSCR